jgi:N-acetylglucosaminyldiphosphoundecaprenol N-acetyl-beta-D-mannosaminyltransferase
MVSWRQQRVFADRENALRANAPSRVGGDGKVRVCGIRLDALSMRQVVGRIDRAVRERTPMMISVVNVAKLVNMRRDRLLRECVQSGDLVVADGMPLVWLSRLKGHPLPERVAGIDLMFRLFDLADRQQRRVFLLGARPEALERVVAIARRDYPGMTIAGFHHGYFAEHEQQTVAQAVRDAQADILLVAMSSPKKELFLARWSAFMQVPVCHGVGGSFDVMSGLTRRAPRWMQRLGLEWLYRFIQEPRRMWRRYLVTNSIFLAWAVGDVLKRSPAE